MADTKNVTSNREKYAERLKTKYPDKEFVDDEALFGQINDDYDDYDKQLEDYRVREKALSDMFASNPRSASFLMDWKNGEDPLINMIRKFGDDFKEALEDPAKQEALAAANKEYAERIAQEGKYEEEYQKNIDETLGVIEQMQQQYNLSDDDMDKAMDFLVTIVRNGLMGKFTAESINMAMKAINHDMDVEDAAHAGEVKGKNTKIQEKLRKENSSDGLPQMGGSANRNSEKKKATSIFDIARGAM